MSLSQLASPCISICQIDLLSGECVGCYRTRKEIARWSSMTFDEQKLLLDDLGERRAKATGIKRRETRRRSRTSD